MSALVRRSLKMTSAHSVLTQPQRNVSPLAVWFLGALMLNGLSYGQEASGTKSLPTEIREQIADDVVTPLEPIKPRTVTRQQEIDSQAWYMAGEVYLQRELYKKADEAFEKAKELNPTNPQIYRSLMETALHLGNTAKAVEAARKAVELDPEDFELLRQLAVEMIKKRDVPEALKFLEQARNSAKIDKKSGFYVLINRDLGVIYSAIGETEKAADCFEVVLKALLKPNDFGLDAQTRQELQKQRNTSFEEIGQVLLRAKRVDLAAQALERASSERKGSPSSVNFLLAQVYHEKGDHEKALEQIEIFCGAQLRRGKAPYQLLASILTKLDREESLIGRLQDLAEKDPRNRDVQFFLAETLLAKGQIDQAEAIYRKTLDDAVSSEAYLGLARVYRKQNKPKELLENLGRAFERSNNDQEAVAQAFEAELKAIQEDHQLFDGLLAVLREQTKEAVKKDHYAAAFVLAGIAATTEKIDAAVELYNMALKANPARAEAILTAKADAQAQAKRFADAAATYQEALENPLLQGKKPDLYFRQSRVYAFAGKTDEALKAIAEARKQIPDHPLLLFQEAWIHYFAHHWAEARTGFEELIQKHPDAGEVIHRARISLSNVYVQLGDTQKGEQILEQFLTENPDDPGVNNDLGYLYTDQGKNLEKARTMIEKAVKAEPNNPAYLDSMGWVLFKLGKVDEAVTFLQRATQQENGEDATIWDHLGDCYLQLKQIGKARESWEKALKIAKAEAHPDEKVVKKIEEKLQLHKAEAGNAQAEAKEQR